MLLMITLIFHITLGCCPWRCAAYESGSYDYSHFSYYSFHITLIFHAVAYIPIIFIVFVFVAGGGDGVIISTPRHGGAESEKFKLDHLVNAHKNNLCALRYPSSRSKPQIPVLRPAVQCVENTEKLWPTLRVFQPSSS